MDSKPAFKVSLSNGETLHENKGIVASQEGDISSLLKIYKYVNDHGLRITAVSVVVNGAEHNLPSAGKSPRFRAFQEASKPIAYKMYRKVTESFQSGLKQSSEHFLVARAEYTDICVELWVNQAAPHNSYVLMRDKDGNL